MEHTWKHMISKNWILDMWAWNFDQSKFNYASVDRELASKLHYRFHQCEALLVKLHYRYLIGVLTSLNYITTCNTRVINRQNRAVIATQNSRHTRLHLPCTLSLIAVRMRFSKISINPEVSIFHPSQHQPTFTIGTEQPAVSLWMLTMLLWPLQG